MTRFDVAIVGAGSAGMAAAIAVAEAGLDVVVLDDQPAPGGQVHRAIESRAHVSEDDRDGAKLAAAFRASSATYWPNTALWQVDRRLDAEDFSLYLSEGGTTRAIHAGRLLIATGAMERPVPIPGWTLPGVMTVGAAQILLKTGGNIPQGKVVIAGQGPLPLLYATQLLKAGGKPVALLETTPRGAMRRAFAHLPGALANAGQLLKGLRFLADVRSSGVPMMGGVDRVEAVGEGRLTSVRYRAKGQVQEIDADVLLLHEGVVPHTHLARSLGVEHVWNATQLCWHPRLGNDGETSVAGVRIAGDGAGIGGWRIAALDGQLVALAIADEFGKGQRDSAVLRRERAKLAKLRPFLDAWYQPRGALLAPADPVIVCRCEEKTAAELRAAVRLGCTGPNQVKSFTRCGMGPCQGRQCGLTLTTLIAAERGVTPEMAGALRIRPPLKPLTLGELAGLAAE
jgi:NADPH-dependent 2,4-dienoyl-CoA reductase/sulfur reductase-like enzyme